MHNINLLSESIKATQAFARNIAALCEPGDCVTLSGEIGAGKTTFAQGFIHAYLPDIEVVSPTFNVLQTYENDKGKTIWHFDLFRILEEEETREIGLEDAFATGISLIEWPDAAKAQLPEERLEIEILLCDLEYQRFIKIHATTAWCKRLQDAGIL